MTDKPTPGWQGDPDEGRRRLGLLVGLGVLAGGLALVLFGDIRDDAGTDASEPGALEVRADDSPVEQPAVGTASPLDAFSWRPLADAPVPGRHRAVSVWTGAELLLVGGLGERSSSGGAAESRADDSESFEPLADGAAYDPSSDEWRRLPDAPVGDAYPRFGPAAAWTGVDDHGRPQPDGELVVLGRRSDGAPAIYDPSSDAWRVGSPPPEGAWVWRSADWSGAEVILLAHATTDGARAVAYDPEADQWRELPAPPVSGWELSTSTATGTGYAVLGLVADDRTASTVFRTAQDRWSSPRELPEPGRWAGDVAVDGTDGLVVAGPLFGPPEADWAAASFTAATGWRALPPPPWRHGREEPYLAATDAGDVLAWSSGPAGSGVAVRDDAAEQGWRDLTALPIDARRGAAVAWTGERLIVWGGQASDGRLADDGVVLVADAPAASDGATLEGDWDTLPAPPEEPADGLTATWTGAELLVVDPASPGRPAVYDPAAEEWRAGAVRTEPHEAPADVAVTWTGAELLAVHVAPDGPVRAVAYDPAADAWQDRADPPVAATGAVHLAAIDGRTALVAAGELTGRDDGRSSDSDVVALHGPERRDWVVAGEAPVGTPLAAGWTDAGSLLVLDDTGGLGRLDADTGAWSTGAASPLDTLDTAFAHWVGDAWLVAGVQAVARSAPQVALYDPAADRWTEVAAPGFRVTDVVATGASRFPVLVRGYQRPPGPDANPPAYHLLDIAGPSWRTLPVPEEDVASPRGVAWLGDDGPLIVLTPDAGLRFTPTE